MSHSITFYGSSNTQKSKGLVETTIASADVTVASTAAATVSMAHATSAVFACGVPSYAFYSGQNALSAVPCNFLVYITLPYANGSYQSPDGTYRYITNQIGNAGNFSFIPSLPSANNVTLFAITVNGVNLIGAINDPTYGTALYATSSTPQQTAQVINALINAYGMAYSLDTTTPAAYTQFLDYSQELVDDLNFTMSGPFFTSTIGNDGVTITVVPGPSWPVGLYLADSQWEIAADQPQQGVLPGGFGNPGNLKFGSATGNVTLPAAPAMAFLTGILFDSTGSPQTIPVTAPGTVGRVSDIDNLDHGHVKIDSGTIAAFSASGLQKNKNNVQLSWNQVLSSVNATMLDYPGNTSFGCFEISASDFNAMATLGMVAEAIPVVLFYQSNQYDTGYIYTPTDASTGNSNYAFISDQGNRDYTSLLGQHITFTFAGNAGEPAGVVWNNGSWDGAGNIYFKNLPVGTVNTVVGQTFTASQLVGNAKGSYKVVLTDATGKVANSYTVSNQIDYDQDRLDGFNPPPLMCLRLDNTYGLDSASGVALTGADLNNQIDQPLSYTLLDSTVIGPAKRGMTTSLRDKNNMLAAGFIHKDLIFTVVGSAGGPQKAHWTKSNGKFHFTAKLPSNFAGPYVVTATLPYSNDQMVLALDPVRFATGSIKIIYSGTLDNTVALQVLSGLTLQQTYPTMNWPPQDETLQLFGQNTNGVYGEATGLVPAGIMTQVPFEVTLDGSGNTTITINFSIT